MPEQQWQAELSKTMIRLRTPGSRPKLAIVGLGYEMRGDNAAGVVIAYALRPLAAQCQNVVVIAAGAAPDHHTRLLRHADPGLIVLVEAVQLDKPPGTVAWIPWDATANLMTATDTLMLFDRLGSQLQCEIALIGIQPADTAVGTALSPEVRQAIDQVIKGLAQVF
jgi:hydrogenase maturation protease